MDRSNVLTLVDVSYITDALKQQIPQETTRNVFCNISSVSAQEFFDAGKAGLNPEWRVTMFAPDYNGETIAELNGKRYSVYRTYMGKNETIELYLERKAGV